MIKYIDNIIPRSYQNELESIVYAMPWYYKDTIAFNTSSVLRNEQDKRISDTHAFSHVCFEDGKIQSTYYDDFKPMLWFIEQRLNVEITELLRIRLRFSTQSPDHTLEKFNPPHIDVLTKQPFKTFVYYTFDSDGDTVIFDKKYSGFPEPTVLTNSEDLSIIYKSTPKKGDGIFFDGDYYHSGNSPVKYKSRCIVNFDFRIKE